MPRFCATILASCLAAALHASDASPHRDGAAGLAALAAGLKSEAAELERAEEGLRLMSLEYHSKAGTEPFASRREGLRGRISQGKERMDRDLRILREAYSEITGRRDSNLMTRAVKGEKPDARLGSRELTFRTEFIQEMGYASDTAGIWLVEDRKFYQEAVDERGHRRVLGALAGAAGLLAGAALFARVRSRTAKAELVEAPPLALPAAYAEAPRATPAPKPTLALGSLVGGTYRVGEELSTGSLGTVYAGTDVSTGRKVVLKRLRDEFHKSDKDVDRLLDEARRAAVLKHPNLAEVLSVFVEGERVHLAIEHFNGEPLDRSVGRGRRLPLGDVKNILWQASAVLDHAHAQGLVHGDLRPANVLVDRDGLVKVCDFGIGQEARKLTAKASWTESAGALAYLAPEGELGPGRKGSDIYSLGVMLYEMLTGRLPFEGPDFLGQKRAMKVRPPSSLPGLDRRLDDVVLRALQADPRRRFVSAGALFDALDALT